MTMGKQHRIRPHTKPGGPRKYGRRLGIIGVLSFLQVMSVGRAEAQTGIAPIDWVVDGVGDLIGGGVGAVAAKVAQTIFGKVFEFIAGLIAAAVTKATELLISVFDAIDVKVDAKGILTGSASSKLHLQMIAFGGFMVMLLFLVRLCSALIHNQMGQVARELFFDLPFTIIGTAAAGAIGFVFLQVSNAMAASFSQDFATNIGTFTGEFFTVDALVSGGVFSMLFAVVYILGAIMVGLELIIRASLLTIIFAVSPVMISTRTWEGTRRYSRKFIETALALMFAKPAAAFALALGTAQLTDSATALSPVKLIIGTTITVLAAFMPFAIFKLFPVVEGAAVQQGIKGAPVRVAQTILGMAASASLITNGGNALAASGGSAGGSSAGSPGSGTGGGNPNTGGGGGGGSGSPAPTGGGNPTPTGTVPAGSPSTPTASPSTPTNSTANATTSSPASSAESSSTPAGPASAGGTQGSAAPSGTQTRTGNSASSASGSRNKAVAARVAVNSLPTTPVAYADTFFDDEKESATI